jgi:hypothetical protein
MNIKTFDCIMDSVKGVVQGYCDFRKCVEAEEKLTVARRYVLLLWQVKQPAIPIQTWTGPEVSRSLNIPEFKTIGT